MIGPKETAQVGGLIGYGVEYFAAYRQAAVFVNKILKGARPADLPIEQATKFEFILNLKTAKILGVTVPTATLLRADEVIGCVSHAATRGTTTLYAKTTTDVRIGPSEHGGGSDV